MSRTDFAFLLIVLSAFALGVVVFHTKRYLSYQRAIRRGRKNARPVRKPFWMS